MPRLVNSLRTKVLAWVVLTVVVLISLPFILTDAANEQRDSAEWVSHTYDVLQRTESIRARLREFQIQAAGRLAAAADSRLDAAWARIGDEVEHEVVGLEAVVKDNPGQQARAAELLERVRRWRAADEAMSRGGRTADRTPRVPRQDSADRPSIEAIEGLLRAFILEERRLLDRRLRTSDTANRRNLAIIRAGSGLAIVASLMFALWLIRSLLGPIRELTSAARRIRDGDLEARVHNPGGDELGQLGESFNAMSSALKRNAREIEKRDVQAGVLRVLEILTRTSDLAHLLELSLDRILEVAHCPAGAVYVRAREDESFQILVASGVGPGLIDRMVPLDEGMVGRAARGLVPLFVPGDSDAAPLAIGHWIGPQRPAETAYLPLRSGADLVGVLVLAGPIPFDDRTRNILWIVAGQLGIAIQNALAHQTLRRQAVELETRNARLAAQQDEIERRNQELQAASRLKSEFLANMSHELRTPLTIILGFSNALLRGTQGELNSQQKGSLKRVYDNGRHLLDLINDILDLSKIEAGQLEIDPRPTDPRVLTESVVDNFLDLARDKGLALEAEVAPDLPHEITTDESRLRQILVNLVSNAVKFTQRGRVVLAARRRGPDRCEFEVRDTGSGIAPGDIPKIFEQFRQLDGQTIRKAGGTGLGLSIVKRLVALLGGTLEVQSEPGVGSSFLVRLPAIQDGVVPDPAPTADGPPRELRGIVLSIDDDRNFQDLLREALEGTSLTVEVASNGREGLELAARLKPDVITLDVILPDLDGWSVLQTLKAESRTADIPVIMLSVLQRRGLGMMLGATDFLPKPLDRDRLIHALHRAGAFRAPGPILIVEDDLDIRSLVADQLRAAGFEVRLAANGAEGLRLVREERPSVVVLDLMMPEMDGFQVVAALLAEEAPMKDVPILVMTAKDLTGDDIRRLNGRIEEIVQKGSMNVEALVARIVLTLRSLGIPPRSAAPAPPGSGSAAL